VAAGRIGPSNRRRVVRALEVTLGSGRRFSSFGPGLGAYPASRFALIGLRLPAAVVARRIDQRFRAQLDGGFLDEVRGLAARRAGLSRTARQALGYRELLAHVEQGLPLDEAAAEGIRRTRSFARRQRAWFRRDPRITWIEPIDRAGSPCDANPLAAVPTLLGNWTRCACSA
jgi:tRNA dimethylallyltransferase